MAETRLIDGRERILQSVYKMGNRKPDKWNHWHWFMQKAMEKPGELVSYTHKEGFNKERLYTIYMEYDQETNTFYQYGHYFVPCPSRFNHHLGSTCGTCGMVD